ncbi:MAG: histidine--tRNA ligase [Bacilli bacterium]|nr:histidine--tRNA ligase [Bacilli bacterium]
MIQKAKGTYDVFGEYGKKIKELEKIMNSLMEKYNYEYIRTPHFEASELFHRGVGETTDIVSKETYDFIDRGNRNMTLRPEGTAGVARSYIENKMYGDSINPRKLWYYGPMYRYERPQSGRFREFYQFGVEVFGTNSPMMDAEVISIPVNFYKILGLKGIKVNINTLGDKESREAYRKALLEYFKPHLNTLCEDCRSRYEKNPLRILDCKVDADKDIMKNAPKIIDYLNDDSKSHFESVKKYLEVLGIEYTVNPNLVRGLDYYTHTVFEVEASVEGFGSQNVLCGGGRYDHLVEMVGGPSTPGVGFAMGIERLMTALDYEKISLLDHEHLDCYIIPIDTTDYSMALMQDLRLNGFSVDMDFMNRKIANNFKQADRLNARFVIIIGEDEVKNNVLTIKDNHTKEEFKVPVLDMIEFLDEKLDDCGCDN